MKYIASIIGISAVIMFVLSYQLKSRRGIIIFNAGSRVLYVVQYLFLGAFEGAALDIVALLVSLLAQRRSKGFIERHLKLSIIGSNLFIIAVGLLLYQNIFSLFPIIGVIFETGALWLTNEKHIRFVSFFGAPCWLVYNVVTFAYGSAIGNVITMVSIIIAILHYDVRFGRGGKK